VANASNFPEGFRGWFAVSGDTRNRDDSRANGWNAPKSSGFVTSFPCAQNLRDSTHKVREADDFCGHVAEQASSSKLAHANEPTLVRLSHAVVRDPQQR
jgi:hypothetical protein